MANVTILNRVRSICGSAPFLAQESVEPFDFDRVPTTVIDNVFRAVSETTGTNPGLAFSEERFDALQVYLGRLVIAGETQNTVNSLHTSINSLKAAIVRDGCGVGDYAVLDAATQEIAPIANANFYVGRLTVPVSYMVEV